ncbi:MAG: YbjN domain-containing protein [Parvularcula sp.]
MAHTPTSFHAVDSDPLEMFEHMARRAELDAQRVDESELHVTLSGSWRDVVMWFAWRVDAQVVQLAAPLELRVPEKVSTEVARLMAMVNERLWLGHFDVWQEDRSIVYRNAVVLTDGQAIESGQAEIVLRAAVDAFERFYPAFNYVIWGDKTAEEALDASVCETMGTA